MKVTKFGGTSMANAEQIKKVCDIILSDPKRRLIVVPAPGKRHKYDIKITDLLIECAERRLAGQKFHEVLEELIDRFKGIISELDLPDSISERIEFDLKKRTEANAENSHKFMDLIKAAGEDNNAKIIAEYLKSKGVNASYVNPGEAGMILSSEFGNARILSESYEELSKLKDRSEIMIFPGFFGYNKNGDVVTFPRGGSDITGSILASAVEAEVYENFTDVDSVFSANPNVINNPKPISVLTYREMRELSYAGFSVLHEETLEPVYRKSIPVCIKNTNNPESPGTMITTRRKVKRETVVGIACDSGFCTIFVSKYMMNREVGFGKRLLSIIEGEGLSYEHMPSGIDNVSIILRSKLFPKEMEQKVMKRIKEELKVDDVYVEYGLALIMLVGEGMRQSVGLAARAANALARSGSNIEMINQGSSEVSMMFGIKEPTIDSAINALYNEFFSK